MILKPVFIIAIAVAAMIGVMVPSDVWAASSSSDHCPKGSEEVVKGLDITCVSTNDTPKNCPSGTYYGKDNQGNFACRNVDSNNVIDVRNNLAQNQIVTKTTPNSSELQILNTIFDPNTILYVVIGISIIAIIVVIVVRRSKPKYSKSYSKRTRTYSRRFKMRVGGLISLVVGLILIQYMAAPAIRTGNTVEGIALLSGMVLFIAGLLTLFLSLNKRNRIKVGKGIDAVAGTINEITTSNCMCCKCQNCDRYHNHWTHDDDDNRRHY